MEQIGLELGFGN